MSGEPVDDARRAFACPGARPAEILNRTHGRGAVVFDAPEGLP